MLKVLPSHISNLIAAGEVVQRPSSVVKELVENSIDAGAENISVIISDSGKTLINVIDDGCGMTYDEALLCFERHATSKIAAAKDLETILSYGFRGEALPSIAAVSEITLKTKEKDSEIGTEVDYAESKLVSAQEISCPKGTNISVRNIFYNIPARRKFLKSDNVEFRQIQSEFIRIALCHPEVGFKLSHNKKDVLILPPAISLKKRITEVAGKGIIKDLIDISSESNIAKISGYIGTPQGAKKNQPNQFFFINGRYFRSPYLNKAILKSYEKLIPDDHFPSYFIFITADPSTLDVNIHPSKTEIKFEEEAVLFEILNAAAREALGVNSFVPSIDFDTEGAMDIPIYKPGVYAPPPKIDYDPLFNPFDNFSSHKSSPISYPLSDNELDIVPSEELKEDSNTIFDEESTISTSFLVTQNKYVLTSVKSGIMAINIFRARERIFYEKYLNSLDNFTPISNKTLFPHKIELDPISFSIITEDLKRLELLGYEINIVENNIIEVIGIPDGFAGDFESINKSIDELISIFSDPEINDLSKATGRHNMAVKLAQSSARSLQSTSLNNMEAQLLVNSLFSCNEPDRSPDGKKCLTIISSEELDNKFNI